MHFIFFFFNDTATTEIYTLSLHDALPILLNVAPPAAIPSIAGSLMGSIFNPNIVEQEYSGNIAALEIEVASIISKLVGYDCEKSTGHFTFGGTGAYLFATKLALTKLLGKESRKNGIRNDAQILVSNVGHYAKIGRA